MTINFANKTIEMSKTESKEASKYDSEKYKELKKYLADFPTYEIVIKNSPAKKDPYKKLTFAYMEKFITQYCPDILVEFNEKRGIYNNKKQILATTETYLEVRAWFLKQFPEIKNFIDETSARREKAKEERAKAKIHIDEIPTLKTKAIAE